MLRFRAALVTSTIAVWAGGGCSSGTGPAGQTGTVRVQLSTVRVLLSGGPLGVAVSKNSVTYVSRDQASTVVRLNAAASGWSDTIPVGLVPTFIAFHPSGGTAYVPNESSDFISVIDVATNKQIAAIPVHGDPLPVAVAPDASTLFTTTNINKLFKIDLATRAVVDSMALPATSHHLLVHPNDSLLYVATRDGGTVLEVAWRTMTVTRTFVLGGRTQGMAISPDNQELYVANEVSNVLHVITLSSGSVTAVPLAGGGEGLSLDSTGKLLYVGLVFAGRVQVINRQTRAIIDSMATGGVPREIALDPAHNRVLIANESGWVDMVTEVVTVARTRAVIDERTQAVATWQRRRRAPSSGRSSPS